VEAWFGKEEFGKALVEGYRGWTRVVGFVRERVYGT